MATATLTRRATQWLTERTVPDSSPLVVDEEKGIIYGVRVCGQFSKNCHGVPNVTEGTEYTPDAQRKAVGIYEGQTVYTDHPADRRYTNGDRPVRDVFGSLKQVRIVKESNGETATRADLHYLKSNPMSASVVEDVKKGMGLYGLSHNARAGKARVSNGRFVVEEIAEVRSVDLVDRPATNKNLWESQKMATTLREIINDRLQGWSPHQVKTAKRLLEEDAPPMGDAPADAPLPADAPAADDDPEAQLWAGFMAAIMAIINGDGSASDKAKQIAKYLKAHEKLTGGPDDATGADADGDEETPAKESKEAMEKEVRTLRATNACMAAGIKDPPAHIVKALMMLESESERKALLADFAGKQLGPTKPRSYAPPPRKPAGQPKKPPTNVDEFVQQLRG